MKIGLRGGHSPNCKGAMGYLDEQAEVRKIYKELKPLLEAQGHTVIDCNSNASNVWSELSEGTNKANANGCDMYVTIHMNASGGAGHGAEVWVYNDSAYTEASNVCYYLAELGLTNRGVKYSTELHDLNASAMPAMIVETLFCDNASDTEIYNAYGASGIAKAIAKAFGEVDDTTPKPIPQPTPSTPSSGSLGKVNVKYKVKTNGVWLPEVLNDSDYAGIQWSPITDIAISVDKGSVEYRVHTTSGYWLPFVTGYDVNDFDNGYAGNGSTIDAIEVYYNTPSGYTYQKAVYRVSPMGQGYYPYQYDDETGNGMDGYAGSFGTSIDRFQIVIK